MGLAELSETSISSDLRDPEFAAKYLEEALLSGSLPAFLFAVRNVATANGGMGKLATGAKVGRESLYKTLSENGNPQFSTLQGILGELGLRFSIARCGRRAA